MPTLTNHKREPTAVTVNVLDLTSLYADALEWLKAHKPERAAQCTGMSSGWEKGYVKTANGDLYILDRDGIGHNSPVTDENPVIINIYADSNAVISGKPDISASLGKSDLLKLPVKATENLANFIRSFGSRLESNYRDWHSLLEPLVTPISQAVEPTR
jgi:hypothetical protein